MRKVAVAAAVVFASSVACSHPGGGTDEVTMPLPLGDGIAVFVAARSIFIDVSATPQGNG